MEEKNKKPNAIQFAKEIKRQTRRIFTAEEKIKIVLEAMRGEETITVGGYDGLAPKAKGRHQTWNKIPLKQQEQVIEEALEHEEHSSRELAFHIIDQHGWYISESSVYRILKRVGLITSPAHIVMSAADEFENKTNRINQMWQTDFTYFKIIGWGWYFLSTVLDDFSRFIVSWDLRSKMTSNDVKPSVDHALQFAGLTKETAPMILSDNGKC